jgi:hypothetical protein
MTRSNLDRWEDCGEAPQECGRAGDGIPIPISSTICD